MTNFEYPELDEPYARALQQAVDFIIDRVENLVGIIAAGSILRGNGDEHSDIDTFVITTSNYRQRIQKFFNGVRFEIFINPANYVPHYFEEEKRDGGASTAHMLATGHIILKRDAIVDDLVQQARDTLAAAPEYDAQSLTLTRYMLADRIENALDLRERDPIMGQILMDSALSGMLLYQFKKQGKWVPRYKEIIEILRQTEPELEQYVDAYYAATGDARFDIALLIADYTIEARGFFEWETDKDEVD